ncbi:MAG: DNA replication and repair protein RecF [Chloroflexi bacterium]|nr:DNA replication and repair protein RecF [Chloroflexota bacterium]
MYLTHFALTDFRNFSRLDVDIPRGNILLVGDNAQGKTSLLEAIYFLSTFTSFHASSDRQVINFIAGKEPLAVGRIVADYKRGGKSHHLEVRIIQESNGINGSSRVRKEILLDGTIRKANEAIGHFNTVLFLPQMLRVVEGSPSERRRYLSLALSQTIPHHASALSVYNKAITQRNALLKLLNERGGDPDQLSYWDKQVVTAGAIIIQARIHAIQEIEGLAAMIHHELTRGDEVLRLAYSPAYDPVPQPPGQFPLLLDTPLNRTNFSTEEIAQGFQKAMIKLRREEIARGQTTIGPHRDELRFLANGVDLGTYGSRGQIRTAMLSLKMAEVAWMKGKTGHWPVLLLDEVLAELDPRRRVDLLTRLAESEQTLLTTTDLDLFTAEFVEKASLWHVQAGRVQTPLTANT